MESELSVRDVLTKEYVAASEGDTVLGAVELMLEDLVSCALVVRGSDVVGIVTEWDVLELVAGEGSPEETTVEEAMSKPVITVDADSSLSEAANTMASQDVRNLVVEDEGELLGVVTQRDVIATAGSFRGATPPAPTEGRPLDDRQMAGDPVAETAGMAANGGEGYSTQGVCEACGSLAESLWESNGQLLCADCRSV